MTSDADAPRLLHKHSQHGYTANPGDAMPHEPEAIPAALQDHYSQDARRRDRARKLAAFTEARAIIDATLDVFIAAVGTSAGDELRSGVKTVRRSTARLGQMVARH